jgi:hypothetical protein
MNDLSARALVNLQEVRRYVYRDENDGSRDDILVDAVNMVSDAIWDYCRREFLATATAGVRVFQIAAAGWIDFSPYDLRTLTSIVRYTDREVGLQQTLTSDQYRLQPAGKTPAGTYLHVQVPVPTLPETEPGFGWQATITGDWGMSKTPETVKLACLQWVENICKNPGSWASQTMSGFIIVPAQDFTTPTPAGMPPAVRYRLSAWRRFPVVM